MRFSDLDGDLCGLGGWVAVGVSFEYLCAMAAAFPFMLLQHQRLAGRLMHP